MASITSSIELYDKVSSPVNKIIGVLNNMIGMFESVDSAMEKGFDSSVIEDTRRKLDLAAQEMGDLGEKIQQNKGHQSNFNNEVRSGTDAMSGLSNSITNAVGAYMSFKGAKKLLDMSDSYVQTTARLNMINDGLQTTDELQKKIYASAERARARYTDVADAVAKLSLNASDAFSSNDETILFAENLNKMFAIAGTSQEGIASATLQLTQALGSGALRGEELNAVFEAAPNVIRKIADYMEVPIGKVREMAKDGKVTADAVKNAMLKATNDINKEFASMPMTWSQVWNGIMNKLYLATQPVLELINLLAENWQYLEPIVIGLATAVGLYTIALGACKIAQGASALASGVKAAAEMMASGATFTATASQYGFNAALYACPLTWIIALIIALVVALYALVAWINKTQNKSISATGIIFGYLASKIAFTVNKFILLYNIIATVAEFLLNVFKNPIYSVKKLFGGLATTVIDFAMSVTGAIDEVATNIAKAFASGVNFAIDGINKLIKALNVIPGIDLKEVDKFDPNINITSKLQETKDAIQKWVGDAPDDYEEIEKKNYIEVKDWMNKGYNMGADIAEKIEDYFKMPEGLDLSKNLPEIPPYEEPLGDIKDNTDKTAKALEITNEDLKYLRDLAEQEVVNRFTTAEIKVDMTNNNTIGSDMDLDGIVNYLVVGVNEAMVKSAEGVHV